eukprot:TRINITY_DN97696_c0_g1_i1.p1 TRINITY_DN97696_c0_g1~~TRINITY_DN97696_c0_g1_i1.p1  ORF type:complete len:100 (+),score=9.22 TRINITY_DN97696_c0_g1_i1:58-357(+)
MYKLLHDSLLANTANLDPTLIGEFMHGIVHARAMCAVRPHRYSRVITAMVISTNERDRTKLRPKCCQVLGHAIVIMPGIDVYESNDASPKMRAARSDPS